MVDARHILCAVAATQAGVHDVVVHDDLREIRLAAAARVAAPDHAVLLNRRTAYGDGILRSVYLPSATNIWDVALLSGGPAAALFEDGSAGPSLVAPALGAVNLPGNDRLLCFMTSGDALTGAASATASLRFRQLADPPAGADGLPAAVQRQVALAVSDLPETPIPIAVAHFAEPVKGDCGITAIRYPDKPLAVGASFTVTVDGYSDVGATLTVRPRGGITATDGGGPDHVGPGTFSQTVPMLAASAGGMAITAVDITATLNCHGLAHVRKVTVRVIPKAHHCYIVSAGPDEAAVGQPFALEVVTSTEENTLLTVDHTGGFGTANGGWRATVNGDGATNYVNLLAESAGIVSLEVKLWCRHGPSDSRTVNIRIRAENPPDPPNVNPPGPAFPPPGGAGAQGGVGAQGWGSVDHCGFPPDTPTPAAYGELLHGHIDQPDGHRVYAFGGKADDFVVIRSIEHPLAKSELKVFFSLFDDRQMFLCGGELIDNGAPDAFRAIMGYPLPRDGRYTIVVCPDHSRPGPETGSFTLQLQCLIAQPLQATNSGSIDIPFGAASLFLRRREEQLRRSGDFQRHRALRPRPPAS